MPALPDAISMAKSERKKVRASDEKRVGLKPRDALQVIAHATISPNSSFKRGAISSLSQRYINMATKTRVIIVPMTPLRVRVKFSPR